MANLNFNRVIIAGRVCAQPEVKTTPSGVSVCTINVAVNRLYSKDGAEKQADFFSVSCWRQTADLVGKYFGKGSSIMVEGTLQTRTWEKDGQKHYATEIVADRVHFVDSKSEAQASTRPAGQPNAAQAGTYIPDAYAAPAAPSEVLGDEEELPFD